jgi:hypothetical protein
MRCAVEMVMNVSEIENGKGSGKRKSGAAVQGWCVPKKSWKEERFENSGEI